MPSIQYKATHPLWGYEGGAPRRGQSQGALKPLSSVFMALIEHFAVTHAKVSPGVVKAAVLLGIVNVESDEKRGVDSYMTLSVDAEQLRSLTVVVAEHLAKSDLTQAELLAGWTVRFALERRGE